MREIYFGQLASYQQELLQRLVGRFEFLMKGGIDAPKVETLTLVGENSNRHGDISETFVALVMKMKYNCLLLTLKV